jgi:hypothetical protein
MRRKQINENDKRREKKRMQQSRGSAGKKKLLRLFRTFSAAAVFSSTAPLRNGSIRDGSVLYIFTPRGVRNACLASEQERDSAHQLTAAAALRFAVRLPPARSTYSTGVSARVFTQRHNANPARGGPFALLLSSFAAVSLVLVVADSFVCNDHAALPFARCGRVAPVRVVYHTRLSRLRCCPFVLRPAAAALASLAVRRRARHFFSNARAGILCSVDGRARSEVLSTSFEAHCVHWRLFTAVLTVRTLALQIAATRSSADSAAAFTSYGIDTVDLRLLLPYRHLHCIFSCLVLFWRCGTAAKPFLFPLLLSPRLHRVLAASDESTVAARATRALNA